jgi:hypothetical protein
MRPQVVNTVIKLDISFHDAGTSVFPPPVCVSYRWPDRFFDIEAEASDKCSLRAGISIISGPTTVNGPVLSEL